MKIKSSFIKRHIAVLSALLLLHPAAAAEKAAPQKGAGDFTVISGRGIENESFSVLADAAAALLLPIKEPEMCGTVIPPRGKTRRECPA